MIQWILAIWSLFPLHFLNPAWTSGSSWFTYCWGLTWEFWAHSLGFLKYWPIDTVWEKQRLVKHDPHPRVTFWLLCDSSYVGNLCNSSVLCFLCRTLMRTELDGDCGVGGWEWVGVDCWRRVPVCVCSVVSDSAIPWTARLLCPWDFPDGNTWTDCHVLLQGVFPTQG